MIDRETPLLPAARKAVEDLQIDQAIKEKILAQIPIFADLNAKRMPYFTKQTIAKNEYQFNAFAILVQDSLTKQIAGFAAAKEAALNSITADSISQLKTAQ